MKDTASILAQRIAVRLPIMGLTERAASIKATGKPDTIRFIRKRGVVPGWMKIRQLADALETTPEYLLGETDHPGTEGQEQRNAIFGEEYDFGIEQERMRLHPDEPPPAWKTSPELYLPRHQSQWWKPRTFDGKEGPVVSRVTRVNMRQPAAMIHRPPALLESFEAYAFFVAAPALGESPSFEGEEKLVICDPIWPPTPGDDVAVHLRAEEDHVYDTQILYHRLAAIAKDHLWLEQVETGEPFRVPRRMVAAVHRAVPVAELMAT